MPEEDYSQFIDGEPEPEIEIKPDGEVTAKGEEIPKGLAPDTQTEELVQEEESSKPDDPDGDEPGAPERTDDESALNPVEQRFIELGLDKQFKGGLQEAIERLPDMNKYITSLEHERKVLREQTANPKEEPNKAPSQDDFYDDPVTAINGLLDSRFQEVNRKFDEMAVQSFVASKADYHDLEPVMMKQLEQNPGLSALGVNAIPILYQMAKGTQLAQVAAKAPTANAPNKASAETSVSKRATTPSKDSPDYWQGKSLKEIEQELGFAPEQ